MNADIQVNGQPEPLSAATVAELLRARGLTASKGVAVAVNGEVVPASRWEEHRLGAGDEIEIVRPFQGG